MTRFGLSKVRRRYEELKMKQAGLDNKTNTGKAGAAVGLNKGTDGPVVKMGGAKLK